MLNLLENTDLISRLFGYFFGALAVGVFFVIIFIAILAGFAAMEATP